MKKLSFALWLSSLLLTLTLPASAQENPVREPARATTVGANSPQPPTPEASLSSPDACAQTGVAWDVIYPAIGSAYVGGTIPKMPLRPGSRLWRLAPFSMRQFRVKGQFALTRGCLLFAFKGGKEDLQHSYKVLACTEDVNLSRTTPSCRQPPAGTSPASYLVAIPYSKINLLSRARYATSDLTSISTTYATAAAAILAAIIQSVRSTHGKEVAAASAAGALALYYYLGIYRPRVGDNYIAVFVNKSPTENQPPPSASPATSNLVLNGNLTIQQPTSANPKSIGVTGGVTINQPPKSDELFKAGDLAMFRIPNHHDYYNISMILSGQTGLTFVPETVEKTGK